MPFTFVYRTAGVRGGYRGGAIVLVAPPEISTEKVSKGKIFGNLDIGRIISLKFLLRLQFPVKLHEKC